MPLLDKINTKNPFSKGLFSPITFPVIPEAMIKDKNIPMTKIVTEIKVPAPVQNLICYPHSFFLQRSAL